VIALPSICDSIYDHLKTQLDIPHVPSGTYNILPSTVPSQTAVVTEVFKNALEQALRLTGLNVHSDLAFPLFYRNKQIGCRDIGLVIDLPGVPNNITPTEPVILLVETGPHIYRHQHAQLQSLLTSLTLKHGVLVNFPPWEADDDQLPEEKRVFGGHYTTYQLRSGTEISSCPSARLKTSPQTKSSFSISKPEIFYCRSSQPNLHTQSIHPQDNEMVIKVSRCGEPTSNHWTDTDLCTPDGISQALSALAKQIQIISGRQFVQPEFKHILPFSQPSISTEHIGGTSSFSSAPMKSNSKIRTRSETQYMIDSEKVPVCESDFVADDDSASLSEIHGLEFSQSSDDRPDSTAAPAEHIQVSQVPCLTPFQNCLFSP